MLSSIQILIDEIDSCDDINLKYIVSNFERKIKREINRHALLYGDNGGLDDYTLKNIDYIIFYYIWGNISIKVKLEEILIIMYSFYKLEEFYFHPDVFCMSRILYIINNSNINDLLINILHMIHIIYNQ